VFARWGRPISPVVFGVMDETLSVVKSAIEAVCLACGHVTDELDPELGSNMMMFFFFLFCRLRRREEHFEYESLSVDFVVTNNCV
jgi:hypothetical protein